MGAINTAPACVHVFLIAGQSNANGQGGISGIPANNIPGKEPTGLDARLIEDYAPVLYSMRDYQAASSMITFDQGFDDLRVRRGAPTLPFYAFGAELTLGRLLAHCCPTDWGPNDQVALLKFASGGTSIGSWQPGDSTGILSALMTYLSERIGELQAQFDCVEIETMFWVQGEGDSNAARANLYGARLDTMLSVIRAAYNFDFVYSMLKRPALDADRAMYADVVNQQVIDGGHCTTVDNNDLTFLPQTPVDQHYDASSLLELGRRLADAYKSCGSG